MRARENSGYIFYVYGGGDWLSLRIKPTGKITAQCNNGGGKFSVTVDPPTSICNGIFHSILLVKNQKTLTLTVDGSTETVTTTKASNSADTTSPLYFGGIPGMTSNFKTTNNCWTATVG